MSSEYSDTQTAKNNKYRTEYVKWTAGMSPRDLKRLRELGIEAPLVDSFNTGKQEDINDLPIAVEAESSALDEEVAESAATAGGLDTEDANELTWTALRRLISELLADPNPALGVECLAVVSGIGFMGETMTTIAKRHKVTKAAVSKRCVQWAALLQLMPSRSMRSLTARKSYRKAQTTIKEHHEQFNSRRFSNPAN